MLRIAIVEKESFAKDVIFELQHLIQDEFSFFYFEKISQLIKSSKLSEYDIIILNEAYNNLRVTDALNYQKNNALIVYCSDEEGNQYFSSIGRVFRIYKQRYHEDLKRIAPVLNDQLIKHKEYLFSYNGVKIRLKYKDIVYIIKEEKNLIYHTKKGLFYERCSMSEKEKEMEPYGIIRVNNGILINYEYIFKVTNEEVELIDNTILPISRSRKMYIRNFLQSKSNY